VASLGVAVIGVGTMGRRHAENVRTFPELRLVAVADARQEVARAVAEELGCASWSGSAEEALSHPECRAAIIATTADTHADLVALAASHGRDILCEKPIALTVEDAWRAVRSARAAQVRLQIGFMRRYDPGYAAARQAIAAGRVGAPLLFKAISRDREPGSPSYLRALGDGGIFLDSAVHDFDLARWLMDDEVSEVWALAAALGGGEAAQVGPDTGLVTLRFARGALGAVEVYAQAGYGYDIRTEVVGSRGTVRVGRGQERPLELLGPDGVSTDFVGHYLDRFAAAYELEVRDWARRMLGDQPPAVSGEDGVRALQIAVAARRSAAEGAAVALPPPGAGAP
jgi:predicted dehydrogenase